MTKSDQIIDKLVTSDGKPVAASHPFALFLKWLFVTALSTGLIVSFMAPREDLSRQLVSPLYLAEVASLLLITVTAAVAAVWLCYPDLRQKPKTVLLPLLPTAVFMSLSVYRLLHPELTLIPPPEKVQGIDCAGCVTALALVPGFWMFHLLRRHATTYPQSAGAVSFLAAASIGLFVLKLVEPNDSVLHLLQWHLSPMVVLALFGAWLGKKYLSW
jgi:hypothetical protein